MYEEEKKRRQNLKDKKNKKKRKQILDQMTISLIQIKKNIKSFPIN